LAVPWLSWQQVFCSLPCAENQSNRFVKAVASASEIS